MAAHPVPAHSGIPGASAHPTRAPAAVLPAATTHKTGAGQAEEMSIVNIAARQRMLSQRMVLQTVLAARGSALHLQAARASLALFSASQTRLLDTPRHLDEAGASLIRRTYEAPGGVGATIDAFARQVGTALDLAERQSPRTEEALARLVDGTDAVLDALNRATTAFDQLARTQSDAMMKELAGIVASIQTVAREAKVVSFNAQVMAARAGTHGREFAVVANVLSGITNEIDGLSLQAVALAGRHR
ncbi:type IV pili methyl-accepting chemotaxis transducer N-terminal domain-containing protein [Simplicispira lacusdiani]|uniref:type IV pili methyl-accepting chemotaxis transducer N-terminal domain-containing protein n=1 Tax=Simplicispira lacusdiani TaxID=2213010 RepID=UPI000E72F232|nr:type IV pili methyl-accepting chemotaxis transducer N-terminal domain-containing protein [Simplicispira lacusdiani]